MCRHHMHEPTRIQLPLVVAEAGVVRRPHAKPTGDHARQEDVLQVVERSVQHLPVDALRNAMAQHVTGARHVHGESRFRVHVPRREVLGEPVMHRQRVANHIAHDQVRRSMFVIAEVKHQIWHVDEHVLIHFQDEAGIAAKGSPLEHHHTLNCEVAVDVDEVLADYVAVHLVLGGQVVRQRAVGCGAHQEVQLDVSRQRFPGAPRLSDGIARLAAEKRRLRDIALGTMDFDM